MSTRAHTQTELIWEWLWERYTAPDAAGRESVFGRDETEP